MHCQIEIFDTEDKHIFKTYAIVPSTRVNVYDAGDIFIEMSLVIESKFKAFYVFLNCEKRNIPSCIIAGDISI